MGRLSRFDLGRIIKEYKTVCLFESGTLWGDAVKHALQFPFKKIISVEIIPEIAEKANRRFAGEQKVEIIGNDSISAMTEKLPGVKGNIIFWLDAHFPGADAGLNDYDDKENEHLRLPLLKEINIILNLRKGNEDVLIIDDLRIYEDGPYENGNVPEDAMPGNNRNISSIEENFGNTHVIVRSYLDEGYLLLFPKTTYRRMHNKFSNLFSKRSVEKDHYLVK